MIFTGLTVLHGTLIYHTFMPTIEWIFIPLHGTSSSLVVVCYLLSSCSCSNDLGAVAFFPRGLQRVLFTRKYLLLAMPNCKGSYSINTFTRFVNLNFGRFQFQQYQYNDPAPANDRTIKELDSSFAPSRYNLWTLIGFLTQSMKKKK